MRVLLISYHYPPNPAVGAVRAGRVANALESAGHCVDVVSVRLRGGDRKRDSSRVHRVVRLPNARELALAMRQHLRPRRASTPDGERKVTGWIVPDHVPGWKRFLVAMALLPDDHQGFILPALIRSLRVAMRGVDLIYTSGPPHSGHVVGLGLKWMIGVRWAAEFRDPWTDNAIRPRYAISDTAFAVKRWLERRTFAAADHIIALSESAGRMYEAKTRHLGSPKVVVVQNGIERLAPSNNRAQPHNGIRILYLGNLYHERDPRPFLRVLAALRDRGGDETTGLRVDFYGDCRWYRGVSIESVIQDLDLSPLVSIHDPVPRDDVPALLDQADLLLLLAQRQPLQIPAKLYEYLGARRRILAFADEDGETAAVLRRVGGHFIVPATERLDTSMVESVVRRALQCAQNDLTTRDELLEELSADRQMSRLIDALSV